jgi:hypothetical protein
MILYYALGGGLGHISRSFALIAYAPEALRPEIRLLVSSRSAAVALPHAPCPMDVVPEQAMAERSLYFRFLAGYLARHDFSCIILDTFPFGLLGELADTAVTLPRILVGRYLRWDAYRERCAALNHAVWPRVAIMIEEQERSYLEESMRHGRIINAPAPISLARATEGPAPGAAPACCIVHSGPAEETARLMDIAKHVMAARALQGPAKVFLPREGVFPVERNLSSFSDIVSGAGYAGCAASAVLNGRVRYHLHPFPRRFDDQARRLRLLREGRWGDTSMGSTPSAASALWGEVEALLSHG